MATFSQQDIVCTRSQTAAPSLRRYFALTFSGKLVDAASRWASVVVSPQTTAWLDTGFLALEPYLKAETYCVARGYSLAPVRFKHRNLPLSDSERASATQTLRTTIQKSLPGLDS